MAVQHLFGTCLWVTVV